MSDNEITIEIAKLDGWKFDGEKLYTDADPQHISVECFDYLTSRDASVPVIEKVCCMPTTVGTSELRADFIAYLANSIGNCEPPRNQYFELVCATPRQLCIALLRATGKWKE